MSNDRATDKAASAEHLDNTIVRGRHGSGIPTSLTIGKPIRAIEHPIDLARHDKIVLVQPLDFFSMQRDRRVTPTEADIGVMAFSFGQVADVSNKAERFLKIAKAEGSFDMVAAIAQFPIRSLRLKTLRFLMRERRNAPATRGAFFLIESSQSCLGPRMTAWRPKATAVHATIIGQPLVNFIEELELVSKVHPFVLKRPEGPRRTVPVEAGGAATALWGGRPARRGAGDAGENRPNVLANRPSGRGQRRLAARFGIALRSIRFNARGCPEGERRLGDADLERRHVGPEGPGELRRIDEVGAVPLEAHLAHLT